MHFQTTKKRPENIFWDLRDWGFQPQYGGRMPPPFYFPATRSTRVLAIVCLAMWPATGCGGDSRPETIPVSGTVVYQGKPLAEAEVTFMPIGGRPATGRTDDAGRFRLATFGDEDGAVPGNYKVTIAKTVKKNPSDDSPYAARVSVIPARYAHASGSGLTATVDESSDNEFHFELTDR